MIKAAAVVAIALATYAVGSVVVGLMGRFAYWVNKERPPR